MSENKNGIKSKIKDYDLKLLAQLPIELEGLEIHSPKLIDIAKIGNDKYDHYLSLLIANMKQFEIDESESESQFGGSVFNFLMKNCVVNKDFKTLFFNAVRFFVKGEYDYELDILVDEDECVLVFKIGELVDGDGKFVDGKGKAVVRNVFVDDRIYGELQECLRLVNGIDGSEKNVVYASDKAREIAERQRKAREKVNKIKSKNNEQLDYFDLISAFCSYNKSGVDIIQVWEYTIYQFNDQFKRMQLVDDYSISIQSILAGGDPKKVDVKHFISRLKDK